MTAWLFNGLVDRSPICVALAQIALAAGAMWDEGERNIQKAIWALPENPNRPRNGIDGKPIADTDATAAAPGFDL